MLHRFALAAALAAPLAACPEASPVDLAQAALGPVAVGDHLVVADGGELVVLDVDDGALVGTRRVSLVATAPGLVTAAPGEALVLAPDDRLLEVIATDGREHRAIDLGAPFEGLVVSPDGDLAIAYYPPGTARSVFHNDNEIAVVALASGEVTRRTLASLGGGPRVIALSPRVGDRRFAFVLSDEHVAVLALDDLARPERSVPLVSLASGGRRTPIGVVFASDPIGSALHAIVETAEATSVYALEVVSAPAPDDEPDFAVRLTQLTGISSGGAATLVALDQALFTLTSSPSAGTVTLTELASATGSTLALGYGVDRLALFDGPDGAPMALAWASHDGRRFSVIDLGALASALVGGTGAGPSRAVETRTTDDAFVSLVPIPGTSRFVALHADTDEGVSVIDAATSRVTGFGRTGSVAELQLVPALGRMFALTHAPDGDDFVVSVDLATLHPQVALAPDGADALAVLPGAGTIAAFDGRAGGHVALWPALATGDDRTLVIDGFLLDHLFQR